MKELTLKCTFVKEEDNKKVYKLNLGKLEWKNFYNIDDDLYVSIKKEVLDEKEKEYLRGVIKPFRNRINYIKKIDYWEKECIYFSLGDEFTKLPSFKKNTMYKGMEIKKRYTLEELGL